jgi:RNA polymerase sigma-70 factor (ECF subfamily)
VLLAVLQAARDGRIADPDRADRFMLGTSRNVAHRMRDGDKRTAGDEGLDQLAAPGAHEHEHVDLAALSRCLGTLDERGRRVVMLSFNDERPSEEIAGLLAISVGNVRVLRHRAIAALRRCLDAGAGGHANVETDA